MSVRAMAWVFEQDIRPSSAKFVLLALADSAGGNTQDEGAMWLSVSSICEKTSQDRKTVIAAIDTLEKLRLLEDTGRRVGATNQVKVYRIVGLPSSQSHYTYQLTDPEGNFYIGVRSCRGEPEDDREYMGSGKWPSMTPNLKKKIIMKFATRVEAEAAEVRSIRAAATDPKCKNSQRFRKRDSSASGEEESRKRTETVPKTELVSNREPSKNRQVSLLVIPSDSLPPPLNTPDIQDAWDIWQEHLRQKKKRPSEEAARMQVAKLKAIGPERALAALRYSTENNYTGLFEPRSANGARPVKTPPDYKKMTKENVL